MNLKTRHNAVCLLSVFLWCCYPAHAEDNKGGKLQIVKATGWHASSLVFDSFGNRPVVNHLRPKSGKTFLVMSAQVSIDWTGFPQATQYPLKTSDVVVSQGTTEYKPIGIYKKGSRYSDFLSSMVWPQRGAKSPYLLDLVFCVPENKDLWWLKIGATDSPLALQPDSGEPKLPPGTFKIVKTAFIDGLPSASVPTRNGKDYEATLKPVSGKFLEVTVRLVAEAPYAENSEGLYTNTRMPLHDQNIGISIRDVGFIPAVAIVMDGKAYVGGGTEVDLANRDGSEFTFLFPVPNKVTSASLLYNRMVVLEDFKIAP
jgi:hypothetical protein